MIHVSRITSFGIRKHDHELVKMYFHLELSIKVYRVTGLLRNNDDSIRTAKAWTSEKGEEINEYKYPPLSSPLEHTRHYRG